MTVPRRRILQIAAGATVISSLPSIARSQAYPTRPARLLVGFPPGGGSDVGARIIANRFSELWGQQVIVTSPERAVISPSRLLLTASPDRYTIIWVGGSVPLYGLMISRLIMIQKAILRR